MNEQTEETQVVSRLDWRELAAGFVHRAPENVEQAVAGPRCAVFRDGMMLCSFVRQTRLGINDFVPQLAVSENGARTWSEARPLWPHLAKEWSIYGQVSAIPGTDSVLFFGSRCPIGGAREEFWKDDIYGLKQNTLIWARSDDRGRNWSDPEEITKPYPGSVEAPGPILVTRDGTWHACYSPYRNWDPEVRVETNCLIQLQSSDEGRSWSFSRIMTFPEADTCAAEAWLAELSPGRMVASCWHNTLSPNAADLTNKLAFSRDGGHSWEGPLDSGILGQSTALLTLAPGKALFVYNKRKHGPAGIGVSLIEDTGNGIEVGGHQMLWRACQATLGNSSGDLADWTDFSFGGPSLARLPDGRFLLVFWESCDGRPGVSFRIFHLAV